MSVNKNGFFFGKACYAIIRTKTVVNGNGRDSIFRLKEKKEKKSNSNKPFLFAITELIFKIVLITSRHGLNS